MLLDTIPPCMVFNRIPSVRIRSYISLSSLPS